MKTLRKTVFVLIVSLVAVSCEQKGAPSEQGELLTIEQITNLPEDGSWNNKLVSIDGYPGFCRRANIIKMDTKQKIAVTSETNCGGITLINANIGIRNSENKEILSFGGEKDRNYITVDPKNISNESMVIMTDDYQKSEYSKFRFSGKLIFDADSGYYLDNVTIHNP